MSGEPRQIDRDLSAIANKHGAASLCSAVPDDASNEGQICCGDFNGARRMIKQNSLHESDTAPSNRKCSLSGWLTSALFLASDGLNPAIGHCKVPTAVNSERAVEPQVGDVDGWRSVRDGKKTRLRMILNTNCSTRGTNDPYLCASNSHTSGCVGRLWLWPRIPVLSAKQCAGHLACSGAVVEESDTLGQCVLASAD
eukprot:5923792-Prymnesium_polylepis.1